VVLEPSRRDQMTEPRDDRPDLPIDDREEPVTDGDFPRDPDAAPRQDAPRDTPGPEDGQSLDEMIAKDIDDLDPGHGE